MPSPPVREHLAGAAGAIEAASTMPDSTPRAVAIVAHPHPLFGGTMHNKVVTTLTRALVESGAITWRFNFRGVGESEGVHDEGRGETDDMVRVIEHARGKSPSLPVILAGFSFGGAVATRASIRADFDQLILVAPGFRRITAQGFGAAPDPNDETIGPPGRHTTLNTVVIHGDIDETVPLSDSIAWAAVRDVPVVVVAGGEHFFHRKLQVLREVVARWVR